MDLPYRPAGMTQRYIDYRSPQASEGFYKFYISTPGYLVPRAYFLGPWLGDLPEWATVLHKGQTVWQWLGLAISALLVILAAYLVFRGVKRLAKRQKRPFKQWTRILSPVFIAIVFLGIQDFIDNSLNITGDILTAVTTISEAVVLAMAAWAVFEVCKAVAETVIASPRMGDQSIDASLMRIGMRILGFLAGAWIIIVGIGKLGADVVPILAGLGVGGLAVALAAQTTLANFIGGILLYANRPVRIGDWCEFGDKKGTVESIGLQSTRVRALDRTLITVPNAEMANMQIINWASCDQMLILTTIGLRYETKPEQLRYVLAKLREMFLAHPKIDNETVRVRFVGYGASSLDIQIRVYALAREFNEFYAIQEDVLLRVAEIVEESGSSFAFPSQTLYLGRDEGLDDDRGAAAMRQVHSWRRAGRLPFPNMAREEQDRLAATLDYPPRGSPDAGRPEGLEDQAAEPLSAEPLSAEPLSAEPEEEALEESKEKEPAEPERR